MSVLKGLSIFDPYQWKLFVVAHSAKMTIYIVKFLNSWFLFDRVADN